MLISHHIQITRQALRADFGTRPLTAIVRANIKQDSLRYQLGHDQFHYDNNQIAASNSYIEAQRTRILTSLQNDDAPAAWCAFGRMLHAAQDFYAHSDYIPRWLARYDDQAPPPPPEVDPVSEEILHHPNLRTGKLYYPLEILSFLPLLRKYVLPRLPADSHAHMSHDDYDDAGVFEYVRQAAILRTRLEFQKTIAKLPHVLLARFLDQ